MLWYEDKYATTTTTCHHRFLSSRKQNENEECLSKHSSFAFLGSRLWCKQEYGLGFDSGLVLAKEFKFGLALSQN